MTKLRKFRTLEDKINLGLKIFCCLLILTIIVMGKSLAEYKQEAEVTFIRARVGKFKENDIQLAIKLDGEEVETPPSKDNYTVDISCDNADGSWDSDRWGATITEINANKVKCEVNFGTPAPTLSEVTATSEKTSINLSYTASGLNISTTCKYGTEEGNYSNEVGNVQNTGCSITGLEMDTTYYYQVCAKNGAGEDCKTGNTKTKPEWILAEHVKVGDYISMTPTSISYTISKDLTGYTSDQTINLNELNLWRVIKKNNDGSIEVISHFVSSDELYFKGKVGYMNYVGVLNDIAGRYSNTKYTLNAYNPNYATQPEYCLDTSEENCSTEKNYEITSLLETLDLMRGLKPNGYSNGGYWVSNREISYEGNLNVRYVPYQGGNSYETLLEKKYNTGKVAGHSVRPVLTIKPSAEYITGDGKSAETAYRFE